MQLFIGELLKQLNGEFPEYVTVGVLRKSNNDIDSTIHEAKRRDLIVYPNYKSVFNNQDKITISIKGFEFLNQILIKETLEELNKSVRNFEMSSNNSSKNIETAISNLNDSIKKFNESSDNFSKGISFLTVILIVFTIVLILLTPDTSFSIWKKTEIMVLVVVIACFGFYFFVVKQQPFLWFRSKMRKLSELGKKEFDYYLNLGLVLLVSYFAVYPFFLDYFDKERQARAVWAAAFSVVFVGLVLIVMLFIVRNQVTKDSKNLEK